MLTRASEVAYETPYFKPADYMTALALLVEPKEFIEQETYTDNQTKEEKTRDAVIADITVFSTTDDLDGKTEPVVLHNNKITHNYLVSAANRALHGAMVGVVAKPGKAYVFQDPPNDFIAKVAIYFDARNKKIEEIKNSDDVPDFLS